MRVLVVDDDDDIRACLTEFLRDEGHEPSEARNGAEALRQAAASEPDVILLDLNMPIMNGWQFVPAYRAAGGTARILVLTAGRNVDEPAATIGADGALAKPFDLGVLAARLASLASPV